MNVFYQAEDVPADWNAILSKLEALLPYARVPLSDFRVAAWVMDEQGHLYGGVNQEYAGAAIAQTVHAEQSALSHAWHRGARQIRRVFVNYTPCGHCRQFLNECRGAEDCHIHLPGREALSLPQFLPESFGPADLNMKTRLLDAVAVPDNNPHADELAAAAWNAAQQSHAPYSGHRAGLALRHRDGRIFAGRYAENAAYNPSLPPLQSALNLLHLSHPEASAADIEEALLIADARSGHLAHSQALWQSLSAVPLQFLSL